MSITVVWFSLWTSSKVSFASPVKLWKLDQWTCHLCALNRRQTVGTLRRADIDWAFSKNRLTAAAAVLFYLVNVSSVVIHLPAQSPVVKYATECWHCRRPSLSPTPPQHHIRPNISPRGSLSNNRSPGWYFCRSGSSTFWKHAVVQTCFVQKTVYA